MFVYLTNTDWKLDIASLCIEEVRVAKMDNFIQERIKTEKENVWALLQKVQLQT